MTDKRIAEITANAAEAEAIECCIRILRGYPRLQDLIPALARRKNTIEDANGMIFESM